MRPTAHSCVLLVLLCLTACGGVSGPTLYAAKGIVIYNNQPVKNATVSFIPVGEGTIAIAQTDENGKFVLHTGNQSGVAAGECKVTVVGEPPAKVTMTEDDEKKYRETGVLPEAVTNPQNTLPIQYSIAQSTPLSKVVDKDASKNDFQIELTD